MLEMYDVLTSRSRTSERHKKNRLRPAAVGKNGTPVIIQFRAVAVRWLRFVRCTLTVAGLVAAGDALSAGPPSQFGVDAPELARLGDFAVGVRTMKLVEPDQVDVLSYASGTDAVSRRDRALTVDLWYPAQPAPRARRAVYTASFPSEPPAPPVSFSVPGIALRDAAAAGGGFPLVVVSHGYSNDPAAMSWLTENLASKGYVVAAIHHGDPPITDRTKYAEPLLRRPLDIVFVAEALKSKLSAERLIDPSRLALVGYSQGGYGVLTAAGATFDPAGPPTHLVPGSLLQPYVRGAPLEDAVKVKGLRAVVAISPAGGGKLAAWGTEGLLGIHAPLLLIAGDMDRTVDYASGARAIFDTALNSQRFLLTFKGGGHSLGLSPAPDAMRSRLWDLEWFEDPVWRKERVNAIEAHFITAFLGRFVKGDETLASYLNAPVVESSAGVWPVSEPAPAYDAYSPGTGGVTVWKGFQRTQATGLEFRQAPPAP
jgi:predicted dienelactone hydrolase